MKLLTEAAAVKILKAIQTWKVTVIFLFRNNEIMKIERTLCLLKEYIILYKAGYIGN